MEDATRRLWKIGAGLYVVWGLLHVIVGAIPLVRYATAGTTSMLGFHGFDLEAVEGPMVHASHVIAEHSANLIAFGLLAIVIAVALVAKGSALGFWINAVVLGIVDVSFVAAELATGHVPVTEGGIGPLLYLAALAVTAIALVRDRAGRAATPAREAQLSGT